jgi:site-specific DNA recombinase
MIACYCRASTEEQKKEGTIETQIDYAKQHFKLHNIKTDSLKWYLDDGISGTIPMGDRPYGAELLEDVKKGKISTVYIYNMKRLGRSTRVTLNALYVFEQHGVSVVSMTEPIDTSTPAGRYFVTNLAAMAELDRDSIMQQLNDGKDRAARQGRWVGGCVPYGYIVRDSQLTAYEPEAEVVRSIYAAYIDGNSSYDLARQLNANGIMPWGMAPEKRRKNYSTIWTGGRVRQILKNPVYKGVSVHRKKSIIHREPVVRPAPVIIDEATWDLVQAKIVENQIAGSKNQKYDYLLSGLMRCGLCGMAYSGTTTIGKHGYKRGYYRCRGQHTDYQLTHGHKCPGRFVDQVEIETEVWAMCKGFIENPGKTLEEAAAGTVVNVRDVAKEITVAEKALREKDAEKKRILDLYRKELIDFADVQGQLDAIKREKATLEKRLSGLQGEQKKEKETERRQDEALGILEELRERMKNADFEIKRKIVKTLVKKITVFPDEIKIERYF